MKTVRPSTIVLSRYFALGHPIDGDILHDIQKSSLRDNNLGKVKQISPIGYEKNVNYGDLSYDRSLEKLLQTTKMRPKSEEYKQQLYVLIDLFLHNKAEFMQICAQNGLCIAKIKPPLALTDSEHIFWRHIRQMNKEDISDVTKHVGYINKYCLFVDDDEVNVHWGDRL